MTGLLFETLVGRQPLARYPRYLALLGAMYLAEPLVTRVYIRNACAAGEKARPGACMPQAHRQACRTAPRPLSAGRRHARIS